MEENYGENKEWEEEKEKRESKKASRRDVPIRTNFYINSLE